MTTLNGGKGRDTYKFKTGGGAVTVVNTAGEGAAQDTVNIQSGIGIDRLLFEKSGKDLKVSILGTSDSLTVKDWGLHNQLTFKLGGKRLSWSGAEELADKMKGMTPLPAGRWATADKVTLDGIVTAHSFAESGAFPDKRGGSGNDWIYGAGTASLLMNGLGGDDVLSGGLAGDTLNGGAGADRLFGNGGGDTLNGGDGNDVLYGGAGGDKLFGDAGDDTLVGGEGHDVLEGGPGADKLYGHASDGTGYDANIASYRSAGTGVTADLEDQDNNTGDAKGDEYYNIYKLDGSSYGDHLYGDGRDYNYLKGLGGDDWLYGRGGRDLLKGYDGDDKLYGGAGHDDLHGGVGNDTLDGGLGRDYYKFYLGDGADTVVNASGEGAAQDTVSIQSGIGIDRLRFEKSGNDLKVSILGTTSDSITVEGWYADQGNRLTFAFSGRRISWSGAEALVDAMKGMTPLPAGRWATADKATLDGIVTADTHSLNRLAAAPTKNGGSRDDWIYGDRSVRWYTPLSMSGGGGNDILSGFEAGDTLNGDAGADWLFGNGGDDTLNGGAGDDNLYGGEGNDTLDGGAGADTLDGGKGADVYKFGRGGGADMVDDRGGETAAGDKVLFGSGIEAKHLWFEKSGNDLRVEILGTDDSITVKGWDSQHVDFELSSGQRLAQADVQNLVNAMAGMTQPTGADASEWTKTQQEHTTLAPFVTASGSTVTS